MKHPKRYMRDGLATTRRVSGVVRVDCTNSNHAACWLAVTSWAGDTIPRPDERWHVYVSNAGSVCLLGPLVGRESAQFEHGLRRRVANVIQRDAGLAALVARLRNAETERHAAMRQAVAR